MNKRDERAITSYCIMGCKSSLRDEGEIFFKLGVFEVPYREENWGMLPTFNRGKIKRKRLVL